MKNKDYIKTKWVDNTTPVNAARLNKIENALSDLYQTALSVEEVTAGDGIEVEVTSAGDTRVGVASDVLRSESISGLEMVTELPEKEDRNKLYFVLDPETKKLAGIYINGACIYGE